MKKLTAILTALFMLILPIASCANSNVTTTGVGTTSGAQLTLGGDGTLDGHKQSLREAFLAEADKVEVSETSVTFTDASTAEGARVTVKKNNTNIVNLYASFTTLWYEAGGTVSGLIGGSGAVELYNDYIGRDITKDAGVKVVATTSAGKNWNVEEIIALEPGLIIASTAMSGYSTIKTPAANAGIPVIAVSYNDFSDYLKWFKVFCNLTGKPELWDSVALVALEEVVDVLAESPTSGNPTVFSMFSGASSLQANTKNTVVGSMISAMNGKNIVDSWANLENAERLTVNLETIYAADPDMIIIQCHSDIDTAKKQVADTYGDNAVWNNLRAVKNGKVFYLEKLLFHNKPNSKFARSYQVLAEIMYPDTEFTFKK